MSDNLQDSYAVVSGSTQVKGVFFSPSDVLNEKCAQGEMKNRKYNVQLPVDFFCSFLRFGFYSFFFNPSCFFTALSG